MAFYAFRLDTINVKNPRGKENDDDVVTFSIFVNQADRGHGAGFFTDLAAGSVIPAAAATPGSQVGMGVDWIVGPLEMVPNDLVSIVYSGSNTSDSHNISLDTAQQDQIELKILDTITSAAVGAVGGPIASAVTTVLGILGDPVGKFLGYKGPGGPCNGLVFSDTVEFTGAGLATLPFQPDGSVHTLPQATAASFTRPYDDSATHDSSVCGEIAHTEITFSVLQVPSVSVRHNAGRLFPAAKLSDGLRHATGSKSSSLRSLLRLRP